VNSTSGKKPPQSGPKTTGASLGSTTNTAQGAEDDPIEKSLNERIKAGGIT
jgi:hypothetical protein